MIIKEEIFSYFDIFDNKRFKNLRLVAKFPVKLKSVRLYGPYTYIKGTRNDKESESTKETYLLPYSKSKDVVYILWRLRIYLKRSGLSRY